uniref:Uncharacterized protein n=1 Tax=Parascaris univalens TaxID=6257 RepID=A0A915A8K5_PARUN
LRYNGKEGKSITILEGVNTSTDAQKAFYFKTAEIFKDEKVQVSRILEFIIIFASKTSFYNVRRSHRMN